MLLDERNEFADAVALNTGAPGQFLLGDVIDLQALDSAGADLGSPGQDLGGGGDNPIYLVITVDTAVTGTGEVRFKLVSDAQAAIATDGTATEHVTSQDFDVDVALVAAVAISGHGSRLQVVGRRLADEEGLADHHQTPGLHPSGKSVEGLAVTTEDPARTDARRKVERAGFALVGAALSFLDLDGCRQAGARYVRTSICDERGR